jgi:hypothetical protein
LDVPRDLAADLDILHRIQRSRRCDCLRDRPARKRNGLKILSRAPAALAKSETDENERNNDSYDWDGSFKHFG